MELVVEFREKTETRRTLVVQLTMVWRDPHDDANVTYETLDLNSFGPLASRMKEAPLKVAFQVRSRRLSFPTVFSATR